MLPLVFLATSQLYVVQIYPNSTEKPSKSRSSIWPAAPQSRRNRLRFPPCEVRFHSDFLTSSIKNPFITTITIKSDALIQTRARNKRQKRKEEERDEKKRVNQETQPRNIPREEKRFCSFGCQENTSKKKGTISPAVKIFIDRDTIKSSHTHLFRLPEDSSRNQKTAQDVR